MITLPTYEALGKVTAVTPIKAGADLNLLCEALASVLRSLGDNFQWRYACAPEDYLAVRDLGDVLPDAQGYVTTSRNVAATRNRLAAMGDGKYLLQLDADDCYVPGALATMRWALETHPGVAAAHGRYLMTDPAMTYAEDPVPPAFYDFEHHVAPPGALAHRRAALAAHMAAELGIPGYVACYPQHPGAGLFRRKAVLAVGGWGEEVGDHYEDTVLAARLQAEHSWYLAPSTPVMLYRRGQPDSLTATPPTDAQHAVYGQILAHIETGTTPPASPLPVPPTTPLEPR